MRERNAFGRYYFIYVDWLFVMSFVYVHFEVRKSTSFRMVREF